MAEPIEPEAEPQPEFVTTLYADWLRIHESILTLRTTIDRLTRERDEALREVKRLVIVGVTMTNQTLAAEAA